MNNEMRLCGNLGDILKEEGYEIGESLTATTHGVSLITRENRRYVIKADFDVPKRIGGLKNEPNNAKRLEGVPGIVKIIESKRVKVDPEGQYAGYSSNNQIPAFYVIKEYLPGKIEHITKSMKKQMLETLSQVHERGLRCLNRKGKTDKYVGIKDYRLTESSRPTLVDLEFLTNFEEGDILSQKLEDRAHLLKMIYENTGSKEDLLDYSVAKILTIASKSRGYIATAAVGTIGVIGLNTGLNGIVSESPAWINYVQAALGGFLLFGALIKSLDFYLRSD